MRRTTKLETFRGTNGRWYYRFRAGNGEVVVTCAKPEGYGARYLARRAGETFVERLEDDPVEVVDR